MSARTLATYLASQEHPEKNLCPYITDPTALNSLKPKRTLAHTLKLHEPKLSPDSTPQETSFVGKRKTDGLDGSSTPATEPATQSTTRWPSGQMVSITSSGQHGSLDSDKEPQILSDSDVSLSKDSKSFTQNLFDTFAMKSLHSALFTLAGVSVRSEPDKNNLENPTNDAKAKEVVAQAAGEHPISLQSDVTTSPLGGSMNKSPVISNSKDDFESREARSHPITSSIELETAAMDRDPIESQVNDTKTPTLPDAAEIQNTGDPNLAPGSELDELLQKDDGQWSWQTAGSELDRDLLSSIKANDDDPNTKNLKQTISHGTGRHSSSHVRSANANAMPYLSYTVIDAFICWHQLEEKIDQHQRMLTYFGRSENPLVSKRLDSEAEPSGSDATKFLSQSVVYVCSNPKALLRSYLEREQNDRGAFLKPNRLYNIRRSFNQLADAGVEHSILLSSLWQGIEKIFISKACFHKERVKAYVQGSDEGLRGCHGSSELEDIEAAHIAKITFAALNSTLPILSREDFETVFRSRALGLTVPYSVGAPTGPPVHSLARVQETLDGFEDELALSLVTRLCKAIASRKRGSAILDEHQQKACIETSDPEHYFSRYDFMKLLAHSILSDDNLRISIADTKSFASPWRGILHCNFNEDVVRVDRNVQEVVIIIEWLRTVLLREWNGNVQIPACSSAAGALDMLKTLCKSSGYLPFEESLLNGNDYR